MAENLSIYFEENVENNSTAYIEAILGDSHINWSTLIPLTIIYSIFLIIGSSVTSPPALWSWAMSTWELLQMCTCLTWPLQILLRLLSVSYIICMIETSQVVWSYSIPGFGWIQVFFMGLFICLNGLIRECHHLISPLLLTCCTSTNQIILNYLKLN